MIVPMYVYINDSKGELHDDMSQDDAIVGSTLDDSPTHDDRNEYLNSQE
jgi:hypothetical protein